MKIRQIINKIYMTFNRTKFLKYILILIILVCIYLIFITPYIGIADNGTFQSIIQKVGIDYTYNPWDANYFNDSFFKYLGNSYKISTPIEYGNFSSFQFNISLSKLFVTLLSKTNNYDIRYMGLTNLIFYITVIGMFFYAISHYSKRNVFFLGIVTFMLAIDSYIIQYLNSFYTEIGSLIYLIAFFSLCLIFIIRESKGKIVCWLLEIPIIFILMSIKGQDILISFPLYFILVLQGYEIFKSRYNTKKSLIFIFIFLTCIIVIPSVYCMKNVNISNNNIYNIIMKDILSLSKKPEEHLIKMDFDVNDSDKLLTYIGQTSGENDGFINYGDKFTIVEEFKILSNEPSVLYKLLLEDAKKLFITDETLGNFLKEENMPNTKSLAFDLWNKIGQKLLKGNLVFYLFVLMLASMISIIYIIKSKVKGITEYHLLLSICFINLIQFISISLGNCIIYIESRSFFVINIGFVVILIGLIIYFIKFIKYINNNTKVTLIFKSI